jgi:predicted ATPase/DNA-binding CsgD family transcriptional regulator
VDAVPIGHSNLPAEVSSFIGRGADRARCAELLALSRLVCLTGVGGSGKSRLARQVARDIACRFPDGLRWADLEPCNDATTVVSLLAAALPDGVTTGIDGLVAALATRTVLLVLDGCEHLGDVLPDLVVALLRGASDVRILATSRVPLDVDGEVVWRVPPLAVPPAETARAGLAGFDAVRLFVDRATAARPDAMLDLAEVAVLCRRLDGLPLAIEIAAARHRSSTVGQILAGLDDRFALLVRTPGRTPARHRTLLASVEWSHDLLTPHERVLLRRLAVFAGGCTADAVARVAAFAPLDPADVPDLLCRLVDASMLQLDDAGTGEPRYRLLETIRTFAAAQLATAREVDPVAERQLTWAAELAERLEPGATAADPTTLARLERELPNLENALAKAAHVAPADHAGLRLVAALGFFWVHRGLAVLGSGRMEHVIAADPTAPAVLRARALQAEAYARFLVTAEQARDLATAALALALSAPDPRTVGRAHQILAVIDLLAIGNGPETAREHLTAGFRAAQDAADLWAQIEILQTRALSHAVQHRPDLARPLLDRSRTLSDTSGHRIQQAWEPVLLGICAAADGHIAEAAGLLDTGAEAARSIGDTAVELFTRAALVPVEMAVGNQDRTAALVRRCRDEVRTPALLRAFGIAVAPVLDAAGHPRDAAFALLDLADRPVVRMAGDAVRYRLVAAALLLNAAEVEPADRAATEARRLCDGLGSPLIGACDVVRARIRRTTGDLSEAARLAHQGLEQLASAGVRPEIPDALEVLGGLAVDSGRAAEGVRLLVAAQRGHAQLGQRCLYEGADGDLERALHALGAKGPATVAEAHELDIAAAVALARRGRGSRRRPPTGWHSLTPAERQVVLLVADGLSNPDIARRLFISRATVKTHLAHAFAKLDVTSRTQLAAIAARRAGELG